MTRGACVVVVPVSDRPAARVSTTGVIPALRRSGSRYCFKATWSLARSPTMMPSLRLPPINPAVFPHDTSVARIAAWSVPVHQRYGDPVFVQFVTVVHWLSSGVLPSCVTHSWSGPVQAPMPSTTANAAGLPSVQSLHSDRMLDALLGSKLAMMALILRPLMPPWPLISL